MLLRFVGILIALLLIWLFITRLLLPMFTGRKLSSNNPEIRNLEGEVKELHGEVADLQEKAELNQHINALNQEKAELQDTLNKERPSN